jgi:NIMA (never in mitosis gene a)-related kinase
MYTQTGTPYYASPEVWQDKPYNNKCDIWSLGCVIYELAALKPPFRANSMKDLCNKVIKGVYPPLPKTYSSGFSAMIKRMLQVSPSKRMSAAELLECREIQQQFTQTIQNLTGADDPTQGSGLLGTIMLPRNLRQLSRHLPSPQYNKPALKRSNSEPARLPSI